MADTDAEHAMLGTESTPAEAFALVGHEIRVEILWALTKNYELSFGELRSQMDTDVEPSQLHYHLEQLVGHFIRQTESGYQIRPEGIRLYMALRAGFLNRQQVELSLNPDFDCHTCQGPVEADFKNGIIRIQCSECDQKYGHEFLHVSLAAFIDERESFAFSHFRKYVVQKTSSIARGVCPSCAHPLRPDFQSHIEYRCPLKVEVNQSCELCGGSWKLLVGQALLADPGLISFCYDHGVDILSTPYWELEFAATDKHVSVRSTDPWEIALEVTFDGNTLELVVDGDLNVLERNRLDSSAEESTSLVGGIQSNTYSMESNETEGMIILPDNGDCLEYLRRRRWPDGVTCPHCDSADTVKKGMSKKDAQRYECGDCDTIFNDLTGTIFAEHRLTLPEMFHIIQEMDETETAQIARQLDRPYNSVLDFVHKVEDNSGGNPDFAPS